MVSAPLFIPASESESLQHLGQLVDRLLLLGLRGHEVFGVLVLGHDGGGLPGVVVEVVHVF